MAIRNSLFVLLGSVVFLVSGLVADDRPIILVRPGQVWQTEWIDGAPVWKSYPADVIIQGFDVNDGGDTDPPGPDVPGDSDPVVAQVASITKSYLTNAQQAAGMAGLIEAIAERANTPAEFATALRQAADLADNYFNAGGRVKEWIQQVLTITSDPAKIVAGLRRSYAINPSDLRALAAAVESGDSNELPLPVKSGDPAKAIDWQGILTFIEMIISFLRNFQWLN